LQRLPFRVEVIETDNGAEFPTEFHWHVLDKDIAHTYIKPASPHLNGKAERSHRIDAEGALKGPYQDRCFRLSVNRFRRPASGHRR
jgi:hypothetical protein